jgi:hypothetical protein
LQFAKTFRIIVDLALRLPRCAHRKIKESNECAGLQR